MTPERLHRAKLRTIAHRARPATSTVGSALKDACLPTNVPGTRSVIGQLSTTTLSPPAGTVPASVIRNVRSTNRSAPGILSATPVPDCAFPSAETMATAWTARSAIPAASASPASQTTTAHRTTPAPLPAPARTPVRRARRFARAVAVAARPPSVPLPASTARGNALIPATTCAAVGGSVTGDAAGAACGNQVESGWSGA